MSPACLDCADAQNWCDTCAFVLVREEWHKRHGCEPPPYLWAAANVWGGYHAFRQLKRQRWVPWASVRAPKGWRPTVGGTL